jgi:hypothetical protein
MNVPRFVQYTALLSFVIGAVLGQAELIGEPWRHYLTITSVIATAITAYYMQPPRNPNSTDRSSDTQKVVKP